jgi:hypothetical protein
MYFPKIDGRIDEAMRGKYRNEMLDSKKIAFTAAPKLN